MLVKSLIRSGFILLLATACQHQMENGTYIDQTYVHEYGLPVESDHWMRCGSNGQIITTLRDGVNVKQTYANGLLNGESTYTFPYSTQIQRRETYDNDELTSSILYTPDGTPAQATTYTSTSSPEIWTTTTWYPSGQPKSVEKYESSKIFNGEVYVPRTLLITGEYYTTANQKDSWVYNGYGERVCRDDYGNFLSLDTFTSGDLSLKTTYYPNGAPKEVTPYANGVIHGQRKTYYPAGEPNTVEAWNNGQQTGTTIVFQNGEKHAEVPYLANKKNGLERRFCDGSVVTQEITWQDNQMHGPTFTYAGDSTQTDWYYKGRLTSRSNYESFAMPKLKPKNSNAEDKTSL